MRVSVLVAEIGSTTTVVNAIGLDGKVRFLGQGVSCTMEDPGDVTVALRAAVDDLAANLGADNLEWDMMMAASSAAGGLSMSVHGLVYDMTVKAAREAALGAGAVIKMVTAGEMSPSAVSYTHLDVYKRQGFIWLLTMTLTKSPLPQAIQVLVCRLPRGRTGLMFPRTLPGLLGIWTCLLYTSRCV